MRRWASGGWLVLAACQSMATSGVERGSAGLATTAPRVPPLAAVENLPPIRWPRPPLQMLRGPVDTGPVQISWTQIGEVRVDSERGPAVTWIPPPMASARIRAGTETDRGFATRVGWFGRSPSDPSDEIHVEVFRGSPIVSFFRRAWATPAGREVGAHRLRVKLDADRLLSFEGDLARQSSERSITLPPGATTKPFVVLMDRDGQRGVVLLFPHPPEVRRWYREDYVVTQELPTRVRWKIEDGQTDVRIDWPGLASLRAGPPMSFDAPVFVMPFVGSVDRALAEFQLSDAPVASPQPVVGPGYTRGYWSRTPIKLSDRTLSGLRMLRYHPDEGSSWLDAANIPHGHPGGFAWGAMTPTQKTIRLNPAAKGALERDFAFRFLSWFMDHAGPKGAPPALNMHPAWAEGFVHPEAIREVVFCQWWELRTDDFAALMRSPLLEAAERASIYDLLQRSRLVHDPDGPYTWTSTTPGGGVWFDYFDVPLTEPSRMIINTHATALGNVGVLALLAREHGRETDEAYWTALFRRGVDGLLWVTAQSWMWTEDDPNELRYGRYGGGPRAYHTWMVTSWLPRVVRVAEQIAPERTQPLLRLLERTRRAKLLTEGEGGTSTRAIEGLPR